MVGWERVQRGGGTEGRGTEGTWQRGEGVQRGGVILTELQRGGGTEGRGYGGEGREGVLRDLYVCVCVCRGRSVDRYMPVAIAQ